MIPIKFKEANKCLKPPINWDAEKYGVCSDLWTYTDGNQSVSLWKLSWKERWQVLRYGKVWLGVMSGKTQPPVWVDSQKTIFKKP
jgi:hypothetical protein